jgi:NNP family nitrate/nitrite transporter-like MFS transporter
VIAGLFGLMNLFARTLGGIGSDLFARRNGLRGRVNFLFSTLLIEGVVLVVFSQINVLALAIGTMIVFSLFVQMAEGATYGVVPFVNRKALGAVAGIVGAGGNAGAVAAGFLFRTEALTYQQGLFYLGLAVVVCSLFALTVRFPPQVLASEDRALHEALARNNSNSDALNEPNPA